MQTYSDPSRQSDPHALPDVEVFTSFTYECEECGDIQPDSGDYYGVVNLDCQECGAKQSRHLDLDAGRYWYWFCFPGCLPDSEPFGPFDSEQDALNDARS